LYHLKRLVILKKKSLCEIYRNADNVPVFVRVVDIFWSIGVMSNMYPSSSIKFPCSAYSISMDLCQSVCFWDAGPEAIGEDMHMYLKCFFSTGGRVIIKSIYSPASQCNVEGVEGSNFVFTWYSFMAARYTQAKRHLWGSLDTGYSLRRALLGIIAPGYEAIVHLKNIYVSKHGKEPERVISYDMMTLFTLFQRLLEAHILTGHMIFLIVVTAFTIPSFGSANGIANSVWYSITSNPVPENLELCIQISLYLRAASLMMLILTIYYYEWYHKWVGFERWALQPKYKHNEFTEANSICYRSQGEELMVRHRMKIESRHLHIKVQPLGRRAQLSAARTSMFRFLEFMSMPVSGFAFFVMPQFHAQLSQLWTDKLVYMVAGKPVFENKMATKMDNFIAQAPNLYNHPYSHVAVGVPAYGYDHDVTSISSKETLAEDY
jgi:hypothetical protein